MDGKGGSETLSDQQTNLFSTEATKPKWIKDGTIVVKNLRKLLEQQGYRCALTGEELTPDDCSLDHIVPVSKGGSHHMDNVQLVTRAANWAKGSMTMDEFLSMCRSCCETHGVTVYDSGD